MHYTTRRRRRRQDNPLGALVGGMIGAGLAAALSFDRATTRALFPGRQVAPAPARQAPEEAEFEVLP